MSSYKYSPLCEECEKNSKTPYVGVPSPYPKHCKACKRQKKKIRLQRIESIIFNKETRRPWDKYYGKWVDLTDGHIVGAMWDVDDEERMESNGSYSNNNLVFVRHPY